MGTSGELGALVRFVRRASSRTGPKRSSRQPAGSPGGEDSRRDGRAKEGLFAELAVPLFRRGCIVVQDYAEEATVDRHFDAVVIDKAKLPELIHEMTDP